MGLNGSSAYRTASRGYCYDCFYACKAAVMIKVGAKLGSESGARLGRFSVSP